MDVLNKMFAERRLHFHEAMNKGTGLLVRVPGIGDKVREQVVEKNNGRLRYAIGIGSAGVSLFKEFLKRFLYVMMFIHIPYQFMARICPLINTNKELTMVYLFFVMSTICGSIANTIVLAMDDRDYLMIRVMLISPYMNFLGKLAYKLACDLICFTLVLFIFGLPFSTSFALSLLTVCVRPFGEMFVIIAHDFFSSLYENRATFNGSVMAVCIIGAYLWPMVNRSVNPAWIAVVHPAFVFLALVMGALAVVFLYRYKHYKRIIREAMHIKHEN